MINDTKASVSRWTRPAAGASRHNALAPSATSQANSTTGPAPLMGHRFQERDYEGALYATISMLARPTISTEERPICSSYVPTSTCHPRERRSCAATCRETTGNRDVTCSQSA
jgi:hypothetical protein